MPLTLAEHLARDYEAPHTLAGCASGWSGLPPRRTAGGPGDLLTRFALYCCAADATALKVAIHGDPVPRASDTWLEVEGCWQQGANDDPGQRGPTDEALAKFSWRAIQSAKYEEGKPVGSSLDY